MQLYARANSEPLTRFADPVFHARMKWQQILNEANLTLSFAGCETDMAAKNVDWYYYRNS